jgi:hypothetical protein
MHGCVIVALVIGLKHARMCWEPEKVTYNIGFQILLSFHFEGGQNFKLLKSLYSVLNRISSSHQRLPEIVNPESLVGLRHMGSRRKAEKVGYDVGIEGLLIWYSNWGQKFIFLMTLNSVQNRISAAWPTSKSHNS